VKSARNAKVVILSLKEAVVSLNVKFPAQTMADNKIKIQRMIIGCVIIYIIPPALYALVACNPRGMVLEMRRGRRLPRAVTISGCSLSHHDTGAADDERLYG
jgi:hypothetical protein